MAFEGLESRSSGSKRRPPPSRLYSRGPSSPTGRSAAGAGVRGGFSQSSFLIITMTASPASLTGPLNSLYTGWLTGRPPELLEKRIRVQMRGGGENSLHATAATVKKDTKKIKGKWTGSCPGTVMSPTASARWGWGGERSDDEGGSEGRRQGRKQRGEMKRWEEDRSVPGRERPALLPREEEIRRGGGSSSCPPRRRQARDQRRGRVGRTRRPPTAEQRTLHS